MPMTEAQKRAQKRYATRRKERTRQVCLKLARDTDADVVAYLDAQENIQGYIRSLIRRDMAAHGIPTLGGE